MSVGGPKEICSRCGREFDYRIIFKCKDFGCYFNRLQDEDQYNMPTHCIYCCLEKDDDEEEDEDEEDN